MNFEDERLVSFTVSDFEPLYEAFLELDNPQGRKFLFLDEIQNIPKWEKLKTGDVTLLEQYYQDILYRDILSHHSIKNTREIKELALYLSSNPATTQSYNNLRDMIGVKSINTVKNYLLVLQDVYLFFFTDIFDYSIKRQIYNPSKAYSVDTALAGAVSFKFTKNQGHLYENMVFLELKRRFKEIYYGRSGKGKELDFILKKAGKSWRPSRSQ